MTQATLKVAIEVVTEFTVTDNKQGGLIESIESFLYEAASQGRVSSLHLDFDESIQVYLPDGYRSPNYTKKVKA